MGEFNSDFVSVTIFDDRNAAVIFAGTQTQNGFQSISVIRTGSYRIAEGGGNLIAGADADKYLVICY